MPDVAVLLAPALMFIACLAERRFGPAAAGGIGAAPIVIAVGIVSVHADRGTTGAQALASVAATQVAGQVLLALLFAWVAGRHGPRRGLLAGIAGFAVASWVTHLLPTLAGLLLSALLLVVGARMTSSVPDAAARPAAKPIRAMLLRMLVALLTACAITISTSLFGPGVGGAIGAFPALSLTLVCLIGTRDGIGALRSALRGLVRALPAYFSFCVVVSGSIGQLGLAGAISAGMLTCAAVYAAVALPLPSLETPLVRAAA